MKEIEKKKEKEKKDKEDKEDILKEKNMKIKENLCILYKDRKNKKLFNGYTFEILCQLLKQDLGYNNYFLNCFKSIKLFYNKIHKK